MKKKIFFFVFFFIPSIFFALDIPYLSGPVNDYANLLKNSEKEELASFLSSLDENSKIQIALLTINSLEGELIEDYSISVAKEWNLGETKEDLGVILIISKEDGKIRIEVGSSFQKYLTDVVCNRIINEAIAPSFKQENYHKGISEGLHTIIAYATKNEENLIEKVVKNTREKQEGVLSKLWSILFVFFITYICISIKMKNIFWIFFWFSNFFGYDKKYRRQNMLTNWTPFDSNSDGFLEGGFSSDDRDGFSGNGSNFGGGGISGDC